MTETPTEKSDRLHEVSQEEYAAVEKVLEEIDQANFKKFILKGITEWFLVLRVYRNCEVSYLKRSKENRRKVEHRHRAILTSVMAFGDIIDGMISEVPDLQLTSLGLSKETVRANVRYMREKYQQWYIPMTKEEANLLFGHVLNELPEVVG